MKKILLALVALSVFFLTGCGSRSNGMGGGLNILATTTILADITRNVAGDRAPVGSLLPVGTDPHAYQLAPTDVAKITDSTVLIQNGINYERFLGTALENAGGKHLLITATNGLTPRSTTDASRSGGDPHMWLDPNLLITYVKNIRDGLIQADPDGKATYTANADAYITQLKTLDAWIVKQVNSIPAERRLLVTNHEALGYFADRYGFTIVGTVIPSLSTGASTSARSLAEVIDVIKKLGVRAIFLDGVENPDLANQIAAETGVTVVADLHLESLTDGTPAPTYIKMMQYNVARIAEALK